MMRFARQRGMTLIEITVAVAILATVVGLMYKVIDGTIRGRDLADEGLTTPKVSNAVLGQIFKDFRYIWWGGLVGDAGFLGKNGTRAGKDADIVQFITARRSRISGLEDGGGRTGEESTSPLSEVGYALRANDLEGDGEWLELWRREDYFVDDDPLKGGSWTLVYDKIRKFDLAYYPTPDKSQEREGLEEWDSRLKHGVPYAILMTVWLDASSSKDEQVGEEREPHKIVRIILLRSAYNVRWAGAEPAPNGGNSGSSGNNR
jgi:prepilin-type N-terminal cleavage/methylation domain-containing protein